MYTIMRVFMAVWGTALLCGGVLLIPAAYLNIVWDRGFLHIAKGMSVGVLVVAFGAYLAYSGVRMWIASVIRDGPTSSS